MTERIDFHIIHFILLFAIFTCSKDLKEGPEAVDTREYPKGVLAFGADTFGSDR